MAARVAAIVALALAMLVLARSGADPLGRVCRYCVVLVTVLGTPVGVAIVVTGEGLLNGVLERAMMTVALATLVGVSVLAARYSPAHLMKQPRGD